MGTVPNTKLLALLFPVILLGQTGYPRAQRRASPKSTTAAGAYKGLAGTFHGTLKELSGKEIVIQSNENQTVSIRRSRKTKFLKDDREIKPSEIPLNTPLSIDATEDIDLKTVAISVTVDSPEKTRAK